MGSEELARPGAPESTRLRWAVALLTLGVFTLVAVTLYAVPHAPRAPHAHLLATVNAGLNTAATCCLVAGWCFIRRGQRTAHRGVMVAAFILSALFLVSYLVHHAQVGSVPFQGTGWVRTAYFCILVPHILLAAVVLPLALVTLHRAWKGRLPAHRRLARWTLPLWLFVSVSGVLLYGMLYHLG